MKSKKKKKQGHAVVVDPAAGDPFSGVFAPQPDSSPFGDLAKRAKEHLFDAHFDERSYTPGGKDEKAIMFCRLQETLNGSRVFGAAADAAERIRISGQKAGIGMQNDVAILTAEMMRQLELEKIKLVQQRLSEPERR